MSFREPLFLIGLALIPVAVVLYVLFERRRGRTTAAIVSPALLPAVVAGRPGRKRHVAPAVYALALAVLLVALARPQTTVAVDVERASIVLALDHSGSMQARDVSPTRLRAARAAAQDFADSVPRRIRIGFVSFDHVARTVETPTTDRAALRAALDRVRPSGGTATGEAMAVALTGIQRQRRIEEARVPAAIVLVSDGKATRGRDPLDLARRAKRMKVPVYTVALGTPQGTIEVETPNGARTEPVPPDPETMQEVARITGARSFSVADLDSLEAVYEQLGSRIAQRDEEREITAAFAGGALVLLAGGAFLSLHWFRRFL